MNVYQVRDWDNNFENDRSRRLLKCTFVCVPNKQHGMGYSYLMSLPDGATIYGNFHMIIGGCSQQQKPRSGWLTMTGQIDGPPWTPKSMSVKFRRGEAEFARALEILTSDEVGWIQVFDYESDTFKSRLSHHHLTTISPPSHHPLTLNGMEWKGMEWKGSPLTTISPPSHHLNTENFQKVWQSWIQSRKRGKKVKDWDQLFSKQLDWLAGYPEPVAIQILNYSVRNDYQGLFEPKGYAPNQQNRPQGYDRNAGTANAGVSFAGAAERSQKQAGLPGIQHVPGPSSGNDAKGGEKVPE